MKAFEKWWEANWWELEDGGNEFHAAEDAWREALKWTLSQQEQIDWRFSPAIQPAVVEKELADGDKSSSL